MIAARRYFWLNEERAWFNCGSRGRESGILGAQRSRALIANA